MTAPLAVFFASPGQEWADPLIVLAALFVLFWVYAFLGWLYPPLLKPLWWSLTHSLWWLRVEGRERVPRKGPVLILSNHVSYVDWVFLLAACPRDIKFVASANHWKNPVMAIGLRIVGAIPIAGGRPRALMETFKKAGQILEAGGAVVYFPEGDLTRTGHLLPLHRGHERILKHCSKHVTVVPVHLWGVWGSVASAFRGRFFGKRPSKVPYPVTVAFGEPIAQDTPVPVIRQTLQRLGAQTADREAGRALTAERQFVRMACSHPFRPCLIDPTVEPARELNYGKTLAGAITLANWLRPRIGTHPYVGVWLPTSVGSAVANVALAILGRTSVNLNYTAGADATRAAAERTGMTVVITSKKFLSRVALELPETVTRIELEDSLRDISNFQRLRAFASVVLFPGWLVERLLGLTGHKPSDTLTVIFSSGSTGKPKGVMLSQKNVVGNCKSFEAAIELNPHDRLLGVLPYFHSFGYTVTLWGVLLTGGSLVLFPDPRQAVEVGKQCKQFQCTGMISTATFLRFYLRKCDAEDFKSLRLLMCGAEKLPPALAEEFTAKFGIRPLEGYGCTELSPVVSANVADRTIGHLSQVGNKTGTIGQPIPGVAVKACDPETFADLPIGQEGMLLATGPNVMAGYFGEPEKTAAVIKDGWYVTGDMGRVAEDGFITITGRLSRFAKIGGEMVPLERVEEEMLKVLETNDRVVAVAAIPDEKRGERLVVLHLPELPKPIPDLLAALGKVGLPNLWLPGPRDFFEVPEMPVLGSGKLDLKRVGELAREVSA